MRALPSPFKVHGRLHVPNKGQHQVNITAFLHPRPFCSPFTSKHPLRSYVLLYLVRELRKESLEISVISGPAERGAAMSNVLDQQFPDDEEEDDFNPGQHVASDDEDDAKPPVADEDEMKVPIAEDAAADDDDANGNDEDEEEEEDEEEDEDEDDEDDVGRPTKRRKQRRNQFIDVEAEVDEDDEEEPEEEDDLPGEEMHPDDLQELPPGADRDDRMHRELDRKREQQEAMDVEETAARLKERYGRQNRASGSASGIVPQRLLMPSADDPRIWFMKCRPGKEREIIFALQKRIVERQRSREPVQIFSAFERAGTGAMVGKIYVEARRLDDVTAALDGITNVFMGTKPQLIPIEEMPALLRVKKSKTLEPGMYVRPKRGLYANDLAMVEEVEANGTEVKLKLIPRLDYGQTEDANAAAVMEPDGQGGMKRKRVVQPFKQRPPARLFSETEAKRKHGRYLSKKPTIGNVWTYQGKEYEEGFYVDFFKVAHLQVEDVNPTLEEVTKFAAATEDGTENLDLAALAATLKAGAGADYLPGDKVEIFRGEQKGVNGRATQVYNEVIKISVDSGPLAGQVIEAPIKDLRKLFREGDHVKVIGGSKYQDEVGMVVRIRDDDRITILTDSNQQEITVFSKDLREATDSGGVVGASKYDLFDLVQLDASTVACVVKVDRESLRVLDQLGSVRALLPSAVSNKIEKRREGAPATDHQGNEIKPEDTIKEYGGEARQGKVLHVHRGYVFAQSRESRENAGVFVARTNNVLTVAAKGGRVGPDLTKMNQALKGPNAGAPLPMPPPMQRGRDRLVGRTVKIKVGPMKAMIGIVKESSDAGALVELHSKNKKLTMPKEKLAVIDPSSGQVICPNANEFGFGGPRGPPGRGPPMGSATPSRPGYGAPPMASGGRTPAYAMAGGGRTPAWKGDGGRTPAWQAGGGGQTAYGAGGTTSYGGQTSYGGATSYGGGSVWGGGGGGAVSSLSSLTT